MACNTFVCAILGTINSVAVDVPCKEWAVPLSPRHEIIDGVAVLGKLKAKCITPRDLPTGTMKSITVTFKPPAKRENGIPLTINEIDHYIFEFDGNGCLYAKTVDTNGIESAADCSVVGN